MFGWGKYYDKLNNILYGNGVNNRRSQCFIINTIRIRRRLKDKLNNPELLHHRRDFVCAIYIGDENFNVLTKLSTKISLWLLHKRREF